MLSIDSILCPYCHSPVDFESHTDGKVSRETMCEWCGNCLLISTADPSSHSRSEIDADFSGGSFGALTFIVHAHGTKVCPQCGRVYPEKAECCPGLIEYALQWYFGPATELGPNSRERIIDFIRQHQSAATLVFRAQALQWEIGEDGEISVESLRELAELIGPWASSVVADC